MTKDVTYSNVSLERASALLIDDQESIRTSMRRALEKSGRFVRFFEASDGMEGFKILIQNLDKIDVVLCDLEMPQIDGFKFLALKATKGDLQEVPVIMITSRDDVEHKVRGLEMGAADYIGKPFDEAELIARATVQLKVKRLQDKLREHAVQLEQLSNTDPLTKTYNRRYLESYLRTEYSRAIRYGHPLCLIMCDIDHFKKINDTYGHQVGDSVLIQISKLFMFDLRATDICARYGGEEFCIVLPDTDIAGGMLVADRYRKQIESRSFVHGATTLNITTSFGVTGYPGASSRDIEEMIRQADESLYQAKMRGRNRVVQYGAA